MVCLLSTKSSNKRGGNRVNPMGVISQYVTLLRKWYREFDSILRRMRVRRMVNS